MSLQCSAMPSASIRCFVQPSQRSRDAHRGGRDNNAVKLTVRAARPLLSRLRPTSPRTVASKGRATRPAAYRERYVYFLSKYGLLRVGKQCALELLRAQSTAGIGCKGRSSTESFSQSGVSY